jgi:hypothetical protein
MNRGTDRSAHRPAEQGRGDDLAHELGAGGGEKEQLGLGAHLLALGIVHDDVADLFADLGAAGLARRDDIAMPIFCKWAARRAICVDLPEPSEPSKEMSLPAGF